MIELILGGARSGKSRLAEQRASDSGLDTLYIATAETGDGEMQQRIAHHRQQRPASWQVIEEPIRLAAMLQHNAAAQRCIIVDCLTLWITNLLCHPNQETTKDNLLDQETRALMDVLPQLPGHILLVSNETGMGIVPVGELTRQFVDAHGRLNQAVAACADQVTLTVAGLPLRLK